MKKTLLFAALLLTVAAAAKAPVRETVTPASDSRITWIARTLVEGDNVSFDWSGSRCRIRFQGNYLAIKVSDTGKEFFNLWFDREPDYEADKIITVTGQDTLIVLVNEADLAARYGKKVPAEHFVTLMKRNEGEQGITTVHAVVTRGALLQADPVKDRVIEFIGDSYTCGYGSENSIATDKFKPETENQNKSYNAIIGRYFDADILVIAHSGMGVARNYNDKLKGYTMVERYLNVFDNGFDEVPDAPKWDPSMFPAKPDITVIFLGANDFSVFRQPSKSQWKSRYAALLKEIKDFYGEDHPILCCATHNDPEIFEYVKMAVDAATLKNVRYTCLCTGVQLESERGADFHPNYAAHRKTAHVYIPYIATLTGWGLQDRPIQ